MLSSLFRKPPAPPAFTPPDPTAAVRVQADHGLSERVHLSMTDQFAADEYLKSKPLANQYEKSAEGAKKALLASLGTADSGVLPDGRVVTRHVVPIAAESTPRAATKRTSITIV